jgi:Rps23 Pro-64 3,4-dihydroxylase Tpa1-like proline 4-hydroxylase
MFYCHPLEESPFGLSKNDTLQMRKIMKRIPEYMKLTIARDGGKKFKVGSHDQTMWDNRSNIKLLTPIIDKLLSKTLSDEWLEKCFYLLKVQCCQKGREFLNKYEKLEVFKPNINDCKNGLTKEAYFHSDEEFISKILPWLASNNRKLFGELRSKNPRTLYILPRFHFSYMNPGSYIYPHLDDSRKLLSMMLYLPNMQQKNIKQLSTLFHQGGNLTLNLDKEGKPTKDDLFQFNNTYEITNAPFSDVNLIVFARSKSSWHSVEYPANLALGTRMSININFEINHQDRIARGL